MATKAQVRRALQKAGAHWDETYDVFDAPKGHAWQASACHSIPAAYDDLQTIPENYDSFIQLIKEGTRPCTDPDCEICEEQGITH